MSGMSSYARSLIFEIQLSVEHGEELPIAYARVLLREVEKLELPECLGTLLEKNRQSISSGDGAKGSFVSDCDLWIESQGEAWAASMGRLVRGLAYSIADISDLPDCIEAFAQDLYGPFNELSMESFRLGRATGAFRDEASPERCVSIHFASSTNAEDISQVRRVLSRMITYSFSAKAIMVALPIKMPGFYSRRIEDLAMDWVSYFDVSVRGWRFGYFHRSISGGLSLDLLPVRNVLDVSGIPYIFKFFGVSISDIELRGAGMRLADGPEEFF